MLSMDTINAQMTNYKDILWKLELPPTYQFATSQELLTGPGRALS